MLHSRTARPAVPQWRRGALSLNHAERRRRRGDWEEGRGEQEEATRRRRGGGEVALEALTCGGFDRFWIGVQRASRARGCRGSVERVSRLWAAEVQSSRGSEA
jgi:hypothetical protein